MIGVNNRDLRDFSVDLATFKRLAPRLGGATLVAESGVKSVEDGQRLRGAGADAVLVGRPPCATRRSWRGCPPLHSFVRGRVVALYTASVGYHVEERCAEDRLEGAGSWGVSGC